jgi:hypothetical protein
VANQSLSPT